VFVGWLDLVAFSTEFGSHHTFIIIRLQFIVQGDILVESIT